MRNSQAMYEIPCCGVVGITTLDIYCEWLGVSEFNPPHVTTDSSGVCKRMLNKNNIL